MIGDLHLSNGLAMMRISLKCLGHPIKPYLNPHNTHTPSGKNEEPRAEEAFSHWLKSRPSVTLICSAASAEDGAPNKWWTITGSKSGGFWRVLSM